jgi:hypothetical protein
MKKLQIKINSPILLFVIILSVCFVNSCATQKIALTPEQQEIKIARGDQETTLALMETHEPIKTMKISSEYAARKMAVTLNADVAQLIFSYSGRTNPYTYRFWKIK